MQIKGQKVLVTGANGFIGSHLVERLLEENCHVTAFVRYNSLGSWGWLDTFSSKQLKEIQVVAGDIRDFKSICSALKGVEVVFHLAALIGIPYSYHSPASYVEVNVTGTLNVLQSALDLDVKKVLTTSTSEVYGTAQYAPINEKHPKQGQSPYSATKIAADYLAESFHRSFNLPVVIVRPFNTYGPRQSARAIIPTVITQLLSGKNKIKLGSLSPTRDMLYVKDTIEGFVAIAKSDKTIGEEINIATGSEISINNLVKKLIDIINPKAKIINDEKRVRPEKSEVERLLGDNKKIQKLTGWAPKFLLNNGLKETLEWFKIPENYNKYKTEIYNI